MANLYRSLGKQEYPQAPIQTSPTFEYEYPPESKQLDFTLRDISQLQDTEPFTIPTYNTQAGASCESRFNDKYQGVSSPGNNGDNTFRKEKRAKSKDTALYLPYSGSRGKSSVEVTNSSERSSHFASQSFEQKDSRVSAKKDSFHRPRSMMDTKRKEYGQEVSGSKAIKIFDGRSSVGNSSRGKNEVLGSMKGEFEDLKKQLAKKERELADTMNLANHLQQMINKGRDGGPIDTSFIQQLQAKQRELEKENEDLRDTVRSEMMVSERNRSQLEVVQNMLERKLESMGLVSPSPESGLRGVDLLIEYQNLQVTVHQKEEEVNYLYREREGLIEKIQFLEVENEKFEAALNETRQENERIASDLENSLKALENSREIQKKLEEERGEVIDYYTSQLSSQEEQEKRMLEVEEEMRAVLAENETLKDQVNEIAKSYENLRQELEEKMVMVAKLNEEKVELFEVHQALEDEKEEALEELEKTREEKEVLEIEINNLKGRLMNAENDYEKIREDQVELEKRLKQQLDKLREENRQLEQEKREGASQKELFELKLLEEMQKFEKRFVEQRKLYEHQAINNKEIYENEIQEVREDYERQLKQEQEFYQSKIQSLASEYDTRIQEGSKMFDTKLNELLETKGQLETKTLNIESQSEELSKLNDEIRELKHRIRTLETEKDDRITEITREYSNTVKNLEDLLASKNNELNGVSLANGRLRAELNQINDNLQTTRNDLSKTLRELEDKKRDLENQRLLTENLDGELNDMKAANGFLTKHYNKQEREIDDYENKVSNTMNSLKFAERTLLNIETDNNLLTTENDELKDNLRSVKNENNRLRAELRGMEDTNKDGKKRIEELESELETVRKETEFVKKERAGLGENLKGLKNVEESIKDLIEELLDMMRAFIQDMNRNSATAQNFLASCSGQMKELITSSYVKLEEEMRDADLRKQCEYLQEWFMMLLKEVEKDVLRILKLKEEVISLKKESTSNSYLKTESILDNKNYTLDSSNRLRVIREEKQELQERVFALQEREENHEKEKMNLKRENMELNGLINELRDSNHQLRATIDQLSRESTGSKSVLDNEISAARVLKGHYEVLLKEKKQLEDFFAIVIKSIPSPDHGHLVRNILELQLEICKLERDSVSMETNLMDRESELKVSLKMANKSASEIVQRRKEVEKLRLELQNIQTQLGIFVKRKAMLLDDLKNCEKVEKRRFDHSLDLEKELIQAREEQSALKLKCDDLVSINTALQNKYRELNENNIMQHTSGFSLKPSPLPTMNDESHFVKAGGQKQVDRSFSRRPSMGGHSEAGSTVSAQKHRLLMGTPLQEMKQQNNEDAHSQSLIIGKGGNVASLRDKLSETKNLLKNLRGNKENL